MKSLNFKKISLWIFILASIFIVVVVVLKYLFAVQIGTIGLWIAIIVVATTIFIDALNSRKAKRS
jgi:hypothetical protein